MRYWLGILALAITVVVLATCTAQAGRFKCDGCGERNKKCICNRTTTATNQSPVTPPPAATEPTACDDESCELPIAGVLNALRQGEPREESSRQPVYGSVQFPSGGVQADPYGVRVQAPGTQVQINRPIDPSRSPYAQQPRQQYVNPRRRRRAAQVGWAISIEGPDFSIQIDDKQASWKVGDEVSGEFKMPVVVKATPKKRKPK